jgi:hypothetical protein
MGLWGLVGSKIGKGPYNTPHGAPLYSIPTWVPLIYIYHTDTPLYIYTTRTPPYIVYHMDPLMYIDHTDTPLYIIPTWGPPYILYPHGPPFISIDPHCTHTPVYMTGRSLLSEYIIIGERGPYIHTNKKDSTLYTHTHATLYKQRIGGFHLYRGKREGYTHTLPISVARAARQRNRHKKKSYPTGWFGERGHITTAPSLIHNTPLDSHAHTMHMMDKKGKREIPASQKKDPIHPFKPLAS